jgi:serine/threonine protein kinase
MLLNKRKNKKLSEKAAKFIFISIISSIKYLHENGILHRDINPENICLDKEGFVKIIGFKYSKMTDRSYTLLDTRVEYKAVETICTGIYTQASELWSCGVIFYELLRGKSPFGFKDEETYNEKAEKIINFEWKQLSKSVSSKTQSIIKSLLAPKAIQRLKIKEILTDRWSKEFNIDQIFKGIAIPEYKPKDTQLNHSLNMRNSFKPDNRLNAKDKNNKMIFDWDLYF